MVREFDWSKLKFDKEGLIPAIIQEINTNEVLMMAYINKESLEKTLETGYTWFWSRSRRELWNKGATSGNLQQVQSISHDCDGDTLLIKVKQRGNACHTGMKSCFFNDISTSEDINVNILKDLYSVVAERRRNPKEGSYTNYLLNQGLDKILKKVGEESAEVIIAAKNMDSEELINETSDLLYHLIVLLNERKVKIEEVYLQLQKRSK